MKRHISFFSALFFVTVVVSVSKIVLSAATSTTGIDLNDIQAKETLVEEENTQLRQTVYNLTSLTEIADKARTMGFVPNSKLTIVVGSIIPIALKP